jgi:phosphoribosylaminoimidazole carboxylase PurE protein
VSTSKTQCGARTSPPEKHEEEAAVSTPVGIIVGSKSDLAYAEEAIKVLRQLGIGYELRILSAHRTPGPLAAYIQEAEAAGTRTFIAMAGMAAALPGVVAASTTLPVIGVPLPASELAGQDALMSIVQMPPGIPVGTMAIGTAGARNAAWYAAAILALGDPVVAQALVDGRARMAEGVLAADAEARADA